MSKKEDRDKVKSYDSLVDTINSVGYNVSGDIETLIEDEGYLRCAKTIKNIVAYIESHYD